MGGHVACEVPQAAEGGDDGESGAVAGPGEFGGGDGDVGYASQGNVLSGIGEARIMVVPMVRSCSESTQDAMVA